MQKDIYYEVSDSMSFFIFSTNQNGKFYILNFIIAQVS